MLPGDSFKRRLKWDLDPRPNYAYGTYHAARQASALGLPRISVIEFGVAGGNGLLALQRLAREVEPLTGVSIDVYGFDAGATGMPPPCDHRDTPYLWQEGFFKMDEERLRGHLAPNTTLLIGDVAETLPALPPIAPVGFVSFDLDYYSSTMPALTIFDRPADERLPRVYCYLDDIMGDDWELHSRFTGELLAVRDFNRAHEDQKIDAINGFAWKRLRPAKWNDQMFVCHDFSHPLYSQRIHPRTDWQMPLKNPAAHV